RDSRVRNRPCGGPTRGGDSCGPSGPSGRGWDPTAPPSPRRVASAASGRSLLLLVDVDVFGVDHIALLASPRLRRPVPRRALVSARTGLRTGGGSAFLVHDLGEVVGGLLEALQRGVDLLAGAARHGLPDLVDGRPDGAIVVRRHLVAV